jgi:hypothetical protein
MGPQQATCDLAEQLAALAADLRGPLTSGDEDALETKARASRSGFYLIGQTAELVAEWDSWARFVADYANSVALFLEGVILDDDVISDVELSGAIMRFDNLLTVCREQSDARNP